MKIYMVTLEKYYDDFGGGGVWDEEIKYVARHEKAKAYFEEFKARIRDEYPPKENFDPKEFTIDKDGYYAICEDSSQCYWGHGTRMEEIEVEE